ncbi:MAG: YitT family protein [Bacteroidales bacterium]|nr:YitT family protein [Bacteroidales bacterium]
MGFIVKYQPFSSGWFKAYALIISGAFIIAAGYVLFITPHKIVPGGVYGISIVLHHTFGTPVGLTALIFNIPLTLIGIKVLGPRFGIKTFTGFVLTSVFMDGLTYFYGSKSLIEGDLLLSSLYGGAVIGLGVGFLFKAKASCGGTDVMAMMLGKWTKRPLGQLMMSVDAVIVVLGSLVFGNWAIPLYSLIAIFVMGKVIDTVLQGITYDKVALIVSEKHELIGQKITKDLNRGGTFIPVKGMYAYNPRTMIYVVLNRRELAILEEYIQGVDPKAFVTVLNADEILGQGFRSLKEKIEN